MSQYETQAVGALKSIATALNLIHCDLEWFNQRELRKDEQRLPAGRKTAAEALAERKESGQTP